MGKKAFILILCAHAMHAYGCADDPPPATDEPVVEPVAPSQPEAPAAQTPTPVEPPTSASSQWYWAEVVIQTTQTPDGPIHQLSPRNSAEESNLSFFAVEGFCPAIWFDVSSDPWRVNASGELFLSRPVVYREREYRLEHNCEGDWQTLAELDALSQQVGESPQLAAVMSRLVDWECEARWGIELQPNEHLGENGQPASRTSLTVEIGSPL